jgi:hypothetical protein
LFGVRLVQKDSLKSFLPLFLSVLFWFQPGFCSQVCLPVRQLFSMLGGEVASTRMFALQRVVRPQSTQSVASEVLHPTGVSRRPQS